MTITYDKYDLLHAYQKHGFNKSKIESALSKGIIGIVYPHTNTNKIIYTIEYVAIVVDKYNKFKTAYQSSKHQYETKRQKAIQRVY